MTVPAAAAWIGVPYGTPMSIPSCMRPQRMPKGLVIGPLTGQMSPLDDTWLGAEYELDARIFAARAALAACKPSTSCRYSCSLSLTDASESRLEARAVASCCWDEISCSVT